MYFNSLVLDISFPLEKLFVRSTTESQNLLSKEERGIPRWPNSIKFVSSSLCSALVLHRVVQLLTDISIYYC